MKLIKPSIECLWITPDPLGVIEQAGRTCYKSESKITPESAPKFVKMLLDRGHEAMIEHASASYRVICDRGVTHEIVRHRLFSYAQESTRYCNYKGGVTFIIPQWFSRPVREGEYLDFSDLSEDRVGQFTPPEISWLCMMLRNECDYQRLLSQGWSPQQARSVLPNSLKTEIVITGNLREWRHFFKLRTAQAAHPQMREVADMMLANIKNQVPIIFDDYK